MGPVMLDVQGHEITPLEREVLEHPAVGGVILFTRNYFDQAQLRHLISQVRQVRPALLIATDHEGGRVQRFRHGFSAIPAMGVLGKLADKNAQQARQASRQLGWLMAAELLAFDIDLSFAPVLDINGVSEVIGDRSFSQDRRQLVMLATTFMQGMRQAGMKTTGKHFPGHGNVREDSHIAMPVDKRSKQQIFAEDMQVFADIHQQQCLDAVMPAHVIYPEVDDKPAGFSEVWLQQILRQQLAFNGVIFSDDLSMQGAVQMGDYPDRARAALAAGCDMLLVCNQPDAAIRVIDALGSQFAANTRLPRLAKNTSPDWQELQLLEAYKQAQDTLRHNHDAS